MLLREAPAHRVALYTWNPLVLKEVYLSGHPDAVLPLLLCAGWLLSRKPVGTSFGIAIGLAAGVKVVAFAVLPLLLGAKRPLLAGLSAVMGSHWLISPSFWAGQRRAISRGCWCSRSAGSSIRRRCFSACDMSSEKPLQSLCWQR